MKLDEIKTSSKQQDMGSRKTTEESQRLVHEVEIHQIELEMQNDELRRFQEELRISRDRYAELYDFAPVGYFTFDRAGVIREVNLSGARLLGRERGVLTNMLFSNFIADDEGIELFSHHLKTVIQGQSMQKCEIRLRKKDGTEIYGQLQSVTIDTFESKDDYILCSIVDGTVAKKLGTELQHAHDLLEITVKERTVELTCANLQLTERVEELKHSEEELRKISTAIEQSPVSIVITDAGGNIEFVNPKFTQVTGYEQEELIGQNPRILKSGETPPEEYKKLWADITAGKVWHGEFHNRKKDGSLFWEAACIAPVRNNMGAITNYIAVKEDITDRRSLENQLLQAQKMEAFGTLAGGIAHDFNNILTAIIGFSSLMEMKMAGDDPMHANITQVLAAANRAVNLVRSMLAFSRKQIIEVKPVNLNEIVTGVEKMLHRLIREDIELLVRPAEELLTILADAGQIEQVLLNLTTNATDSLETGGEISITTEPAELDETFRKAHGFGDTGRYALLTFSDNGTGMTESIRQKIFEPFFTTKEVGKGTGLGLSVCYGIIRQHGGNIICYSEPGIGTTFRIYLPLTPLPADKEIKVLSSPIARGTETILVAEDDSMVRDLTSRFLTEFGYRVIEARDGEEAVARFLERADEIQLCLFDMIMPKKNGRDAFDEIRKLRPDLKCLFMSGYQANFSNHEGADLITKPVMPKVLLQKLREMLNEESSNKPEAGS